MFFNSGLASHLVFVEGAVVLVILVLGRKYKVCDLEIPPVSSGMVDTGFLRNTVRNGGAGVDGRAGSVYMCAFVSLCARMECQTIVPEFWLFVARKGGFCVRGGKRAISNGEEIRLLSAPGLPWRFRDVSKIVSDISKI